MVDQFCDFFVGRREEVVRRLQQFQKDAAARREYERAGRIRDQVRGIESILARQRVVDLSGSEADVIGVARQGEAACAVIFKIRERRVVSRDVRWLQGAGKTDEAELLRAFLTLYYTRAEQVPACVLVEVEPAEAKLLERVLSASASSGVRVRTPRGTAERALVRNARRNAALLLGRLEPLLDRTAGASEQRGRPRADSLHVGVDRRSQGRGDYTWQRSAVSPLGSRLLWDEHIRPHFVAPTPALRPVYLRRVRYASRRCRAVPGYGGAELAASQARPIHPRQ